jgi:hypothetical protein
MTDTDDGPGRTQGTYRFTRGKAVWVGAPPLVRPSSPPHGLRVQAGRADGKGCGVRRAHRGLGNRNPSG